MDIPHRSRPNRLDQLLVERGFFESRARARDAILRETVSVDGTSVTKPSQSVRADASITVNDPARDYVSRAALKLKHALEQFDVPVAGQICVDLGASTGGFTQVLLENGAEKVHAIDVGHGQLDARLRDDPRVHVLEKLNARNLSADNIGHDRPGVVVCDVSFISLKLTLPPVLALARAGAHLVALVKPQFEVGRSKVGKGGLVSEQDALAAAEDLKEWLAVQPGWRVARMVPSPITGGDGNREFLLWGVKEG